MMVDDPLLDVSSFGLIVKTQGLINGFGTTNINPDELLFVLVNGNNFC